MTSNERVFATNAQLITFAASVGFAEKRFEKAPVFLKNNPEPIDIEIFRNQHLFQFAQLLALAHEKKHDVALNEERIAEILEGYATTGFETMKRWYEEKSGDDAVFVQHLIGEVMKRSLAFS